MRMMPRAAALSGSPSRHKSIRCQVSPNAGSDKAMTQLRLAADMPA